MQITHVEKDPGSGMWFGAAIDGEKKYEWFYRPRGMFRMSVAEKGILGCWIHIDPPPAAKRSVQRAIRASIGK